METSAGEDKQALGSPRSTDDLYCKQESTNRQRDFGHYNGRGAHSSTAPRYPGWNFSERIFDRQPSSRCRICHPPEEQFRWLREMPSSWHRQSAGLFLMSVLPRKYAGPICLLKYKAADVKSLLEYILPNYHSFYNSIVVDNLCCSLAQTRSSA